jgi:hypothetical protein
MLLNYQLISSYTIILVSRKKRKRKEKEKKKKKKKIRKEKKEKSGFPQIFCTSDSSFLSFIRLFIDKIVHIRAL